MSREFSIAPTPPPQGAEPPARPRDDLVVREREAKDVSQAAVNARRLKVVDAVARTEGVEGGRLVIEKDAETGQFVHKLVNADTGDVMKQWPNEEFLSRAKQIASVVGLWFDKRA